LPLLLLPQLLQASLLRLYELTVEAAAAAGDAPPLPVLQTIVAAVAEVAAGSATHLYWAQQYAQAAAYSGDAGAEAEAVRLAAFQLRYGSTLSSELYSQIAALPATKPVRQVAAVTCDFAHDYCAQCGRDHAIDGSGGEGSRAAEEADAAVDRAYFADDADEAAYKLPDDSMDLTRSRVHAEL
jgi:hypothetical protein